MSATDRRNCVFVTDSSSVGRSLKSWQGGKRGQKGQKKDPPFALCHIFVTRVRVQMSQREKRNARTKSPL